MTFFEQLMIAAATEPEAVAVTTEAEPVPEKPFAVIFDGEPIAWFDNESDALLDATEIGGAVFNVFSKTWIQ